MQHQSKPLHCDVFRCSIESDRCPSKGLLCKPSNCARISGSKRQGIAIYVDDSSPSREGIHGRTTGKYTEFPNKETGIEKTAHLLKLMLRYFSNLMERPEAFDCYSLSTSFSIIDVCKSPGDQRFVFYLLHASNEKRRG